MHERFDEYIRGVRYLGRALIMCHDYPDPDALASALGLRVLLETRYGIECAITYGGIIGRAENKTMERILNIGAVPIEIVDASAYPLVALVDTQPGTGNNSLPDGRIPDIVIDHHRMVPLLSQVPYADVRDDGGSTSTMIFGYLKAFGIEADRDLATAITYAIRAETQDLGRDFDEADKRAYYELVPAADNLKMHQIVNARVPAGYFHGLIYAVENASRYGSSYLVSDVGRMDFPELVAEMADIFMRLHHVEWVLCVGNFKGNGYLSMRTRARDQRAGDVMRELVRDLGTGGGHATMAGGQLLLKSPSDYDDVRRAVFARFRDTFGLSEADETELLNIVE